MKSKIVGSGLFLCMFFLNASAQTDIDALRYSQPSLTGTARYSAMGGAMGALGGDFTSITSNPAAVGIYRSSEFNISASLFDNHTSSTFLGRTSDDSRFNFNIPSFGFVFARQLKNQTGAGWRSWGIGVGLNRINNFQSTTYYEGFNPKNSLLDKFVENAGTRSADELINNDPYAFNEGLAVSSSLLYLDSVNQWTNDFIEARRQGLNAGIWQSRNATTRGSQNEWNISFGANYNDAFYIGAAIGIRSIRYEEQSTYVEDDKDNAVPYLNSFSFSQNFTTTGTGFNFNLGLIARPADWIRIGAAVHTPTIYNLHDNYNNSMSSSIEGYNDTTVDSPFGSFDYELTTPLRATGSLGFIIGTSGSIGLEYEFLNYSDSRFQAPGASYGDLNDFIRNNYTSAGNLKIGGEYRYDNFSFRAGYGLYGSPMMSTYKVSGEDFSKSNYSVGVGIRDSNYFLDFAYVYSTTNQHYQPYVLTDPSVNPNTDVPGVKNEITSHNVVFTFGVKF